jgi:hypothetical protein
MVKVSAARRGQSGLEYSLLIMVAAAGIIAMIVYVGRGYVGRGHQGHVRSQADQLSDLQYAPGQTTINNNVERKTTTKTEGAGSWTQVKHSDHPVGETNGTLLAELDRLKGFLKNFYYWQDHWEQYVVSEGENAADKVAGGQWPWVEADGGPELPMAEQQIAVFDGLMNSAQDAVNSAENSWPDREPDTTTSGSGSFENGTITTNNHVNETIDNLQER